MFVLFDFPLKRVCVCRLEKSIASGKARQRGGKCIITLPIIVIAVEPLFVKVRHHIETALMSQVIQGLLSAELFLIIHVPVIICIHSTSRRE